MNMRRQGLGLSCALLLALTVRAEATTAELAHSALEKIPGFEFALGSVGTLSNVDGVFTADVTDLQASLSVFQITAEAEQPWHVQLVLDDPDRFSFRSISPRLGQNILGNVSTTQMVVIASTADDVALLATFPAPIRPVLSGYADAEGRVSLMQGVNVFSSFRIGTDGLLGLLNKAIQIGDGQVRLTGQLDKETIKLIFGATGSADTPDPASRVALSVEIPSVTPLPFGLINDKDMLHLEYPSTTLSIARTSRGTNDAYDISGTQEAAVWILGRPFSGTTSLTFSSELDKSYSMRLDSTINLTFQNPLGVSGVSLDKLLLSGEFDSQSGGSSGPNQNSLGLSFGVEATLSGHGSLEGTVGSKIENGNITDLKLTVTGADADSGISLGALPLFNVLPVANLVTFKQLVAGMNPQSKDAYLKGTVAFEKPVIEANASILRKKMPDGKHTVILALKTEGMNLLNFVPSLPPQAAQLSLDGGVWTISTADLRSMKPGSLPDSFKEIFSGMSTGGSASSGSAGSGSTIPSFDPNFSVDIPMGTGLTVPIDVAALSDEIQAAMTRLGINEPLVLSGSIGGVFDGDPSLMLYAKLPTVPIPQIGDQALNVRPTDMQGSLFVDIGKQGTGVAMKLGVDGTLGMIIGDDQLDFGGRVFLILSAMSQGVQLDGRMDGEWDDPFGMVGIAFGDVQIGGGVNADSSIELNLKGTAEFGEGLNFAMGADVSAIVGSGIPIPKKVGLMFQGSEMSMMTQVKVHNALLKAAAAGPLANAIPDGPTKMMLQDFAQFDLISSVENTIPLPYVIYKDVAVYLATPGASVPGFDGIGGLGGAVRGTMYFMGQDFGSVDSFLTLQNGLKLNAAPGDFNMGPGISLNNAELDIRIPMPGINNDEKAYAKLRGQMSAGCDFMSGAIDMEFSRDIARFAASGELAGYQTSFDAEVDLSNFPSFLTNGTFSPELVTDILAAIGERAQQKFEEKKAQAQGAVDAATSAVTTAKTVVTNRVAHEKEVMRKKAQSRIQAIVNELARRENAARFPGEATAWRAARNAAKAMVVQPNGSVSGVSNFKKKINYVKYLTSQLSNWWGSSIKNAANNAVNSLHRKINGIVSYAKNIASTVSQLPIIQDLQAAVATAQETLEQAKKDVLAVTLDPVAAKIKETASILTIDDIGFDSGLDALCKKRLPKLTITGSFEGKPFQRVGIFQLATREEFVATNAAALDSFMTSLSQ